MSVTVCLPSCLTWHSPASIPKLALVLSFISADEMQLHTTHGDLKLELFCEVVPKTTENFLALCASGVYDGSPVHRLIPTFMFQTGSPASQSTKTSTSIWGEPFDDEISPALRHNKRGIVSMASKGSTPNTNGSQFFVTFAPAPHLDGKNSVFGCVLQGSSNDATMRKLEAINVDAKNRPKDTKVAIERITIHANPLADG